MSRPPESADLREQFRMMRYGVFVLADHEASKFLTILISLGSLLPPYRMNAKTLRSERDNEYKVDFDYRLEANGLRR